MLHALPGLARGPEDGGDQNGVKPTAGTELQVGDDRGDGGEMSASLGEDQAAQHAGGIHAKSVSDAAAEALVHQHGIGMKFQGEGERLRLAAVKVGSGDGKGECDWEKSPPTMPAKQDARAKARRGPQAG